MATETHGASGADKVFPPFDFAGTLSSQLLWLTVTFGIFYILMAKLVLPRIGSILEMRSDRIAQDIDEANRLQQQSDEAHAAYEQELADAKSRALSIAQEAKDRAKSQLETKRSELDSQFASQLQTSEQKITKAKETALANLSEIAEPTAKAILAQVFAGNVSDEDLTKAIQSVRK